MSSEMFENDTAMYRKEKAWHGLGVVVNEDCNPRQALREAHLDWNVVPSTEVSCTYQTADGWMDTSNTTKKVANIRQDTGDIVGWVSPSYNVVQNAELAELAYSLGGDDTVVESFGSLRNGGRIYCLVKCDSFMAQSNDRVEQYMLLCNGHDGSMTLSGLPTSVRVVCANTLHMAMANGSKNMFRFTHQGDMQDKLSQATEALGFFRETGRFFKDNVSRLVATDWDKEQIQRFWLDVYQDLNKETVVLPSKFKTDEDENIYKRAVSAISTWSTTFDNEMQELNVNRPNAWIAANAVTNYLQFNESKKGRKTSSDSRVDNNLFGKNASNSITVMKKALQHC
jgi:phage/plasmid-like protein (TIGR03299 family)